jgi:transposase-like protein
MVMDYCGGSLVWAADELGVTPSTLWRWRTTIRQGGTLEYGQRCGSVRGRVVGAA